MNQDDSGERYDRTRGMDEGGPQDAPTRSGFIALAGRPNVGKSTLTNRVVGQKVAIVSDKPQTTRRAIRGVSTGEHHQIVLVDLPGVQRPRDKLTERMQRRVEKEAAQCDAVILNAGSSAGTVGTGCRRPNVLGLRSSATIRISSGSPARRKPPTSRAS